MELKRDRRINWKCFYVHNAVTLLEYMYIDIRKKSEDGIKIGNQINIYMVLILRPNLFFLETTSNPKQMSLKYIFGRIFSWTSLLAQW